MFMMFFDTIFSGFLPYNLTRGLRVFAINAAAAIFRASPMRKGTMPTVMAFSKDMEVTALSQGTPQA